MTAVAPAAAAAPQAGVHSPRGRARSQLLPRRPYPGLRPFEKAEWPTFRGRDRLIQNVLTILAERHFASVIGPSGSGKSSLVRAGVLAALERRHGRLGVRWRTATMRPGVSPLWSMADGLLRSLRPELVASDGELPAADVAKLRVQIDASAAGLAGLLGTFDLEEHENVLLLVDQFEEIFRYRSNEEDRERARLVELLVEVAHQRPPGFYVVTTMRSEYLGDCARFSGLAETLNESHYLLPRMSDAELRQAIVEPAGIKSGSIHEELVDRLIGDIEGQEDQLPILQHTLLWLWIQEEEKREREGAAGSAGIELGLAAYEQLEAGRDVGKTVVKNALSRHGDRILNGLSPEERRVAAVMFRRLVEVEEHSNRLRRPTQCGTVARLAQVPLEVVQRVVDAFRAEDASFIHASRQSVTDDTSIDITHESLIRQWTRLDAWVREEAASYEVYHDLYRAARQLQDGEGALLTGRALSRALDWLYEEQPTRLWARRYGGDFDLAISFLTSSEEAEERRAREQQAALEAARRQEEIRRRRFTQLTASGAVVAGLLAMVAGYGFWQAREAEIATKAGAFWYRLQLFGDPLKPDAVETLWDLVQQDENVRVEFVRQLADRPELLQRFGFKPQPIARAVGLRWPEEARQIARRSVTHVASAAFDARAANRFELITYTRALAALQHWLDPELAATAKAKIAGAINAMAADDPLTDRQLWTLAETVATFSAHLDAEAIAAARDRLRQEIAAPAAPESSDRRGRAVSRTIEIMARDLDPTERAQAVRALAPLLGHDVDSWSAKSTPHALLALAPRLDVDEATPLLEALPPAIARSAGAKADDDGSYLLALIRLTEMLAGSDDQELVAAFVDVLIEQFKLPNDPSQHAALARATIPLLGRLGDRTKILVPTIAGITMVPVATGAGLDPPQRALLHKKALADLEKAQAALARALAPAAGEQSAADGGDALRILRGQWQTPNGERRKVDQYRRAAQVRLAAMLAPSLVPDAAAAVTADLREMLLATPDYLTREAVARAFAAVAPRLQGAERQAALEDAKRALATTGSTDEATAWAGAIAALLPTEPYAATAEIVEALKYPTATEATTDVLLAALAAPWPRDYQAIAGRTLPDQVVLEWLEKHVPEGEWLRDPPPPPPRQAADAPLDPS